MRIAFDILTLIVALQHFFFMALECVFWTKPLGRRIFRLSEQQAQITASLAANQGVYNGFLAAGLVACVLRADVFTDPVRAFFLGCVVVAAIVGALTVSRRILFVQGVPATLALILLFLQA